MKRIFTIRINVRINTSFFVKGCMLSFFCNMLPGCVNNMNGSENLPAPQSMQNETNMLKVNNPSANSGETTQPNIAGSREESSDGKNNTGSMKSQGFNRFPEKNIPLTPAPAKEADQDPQYHDIQDEEHVICIKFPAMMRIAIMMFFAVVMVLQIIPAV